MKIHKIGDNTGKNVNAATAEMYAFKREISSEKNYKVEVAIEDGVIYAVYISEVEE